MINENYAQTIKSEIRKIKTKVGQSNFISNISANLKFEVNNTSYSVCGDTILIVLNEKFRRRLYFASGGEISEFQSLLKDVPDGVVCDFIIRERELEAICNAFFSAIGLAKYSVYARITDVYGDQSPYSIPETGRRRILSDMYDPSFGEYPEAIDADELFRLNKETFDANTDDIYSIDEWKEIIKQRQCLCYKENGEIVSYYVFKPEGRKLYSNISVNRGPANYLYNLERRVFEEYFQQGARVFYAWVDEKNDVQMKKIRNSELEKVRKSRTYLYNLTYIKV